jgi:hypothetical protein
VSALAGRPPTGLVPPTTPSGRSGFLADVIVELGLAEPDAVEQATRESRLNGATLAAVLLGRGVLEEQDLARAVAERHGLAMVDLDTFPVDPDAVALVSRGTARRYGVLPAGFAPDGSLMLAMADPGDSLAIDDVAVMTKLEVTPVIASRTQIDSALEQLPETGAVTPESDDPAGGPGAGGLLWQAEESGPADQRRRSLGPAEPRTADLELYPATARAELEELRGRHERKTAELEAQGRKLREELGELDGRVAELEGELAHRDRRLGELELQLADRDAALRELQSELAASRRGAA